MHVPTPMPTSFPLLSIVAISDELEDQAIIPSAFSTFADKNMVCWTFSSIFSDSLMIVMAGCGIGEEEVVLSSGCVDEDESSSSGLEMLDDEFGGSN